MKKYEPIVLTPKHWELYNLVKERTLEKGSLTIQDICEALPQYWKVSIEEKHRTNCPNLYKTIDEINLSTEVDKWIIKGRNHIRIATKEDIEILDQKYARELSRVSSLRYRLRKKYQANNQCKLLSNKGVPIEESKGRRHIETYVK